LEPTVSRADRAVRPRFWLELTCGLLAIALFVTTLITREWIELIFGTGADGGSGTLELAITFGPLAVSLLSGGLAVDELRRAQPT
jgi:hypothetical protein